MSMVSQVTLLTDEQIIWCTPLARIGYYVAQYARKIGVKNVQRKSSHEKQVNDLELIREYINGKAEARVSS